MIGILQLKSIIIGLMSPCELKDFQKILFLLKDVS